MLKRVLGLLGWLGVALTGSDTASNVLFGNLQKITSQQLGLSPILMSAANSSGGVMGKMIDAQSIVVASTATNWYGHEGTILRFEGQGESRQVHVNFEGAGRKILMYSLARLEQIS